MAGEMSAEALGDYKRRYQMFLDPEVRQAAGTAGLSLGRGRQTDESRRSPSLPHTTAGKL